MSIMSYLQCETPHLYNFLLNEVVYILHTSKYIYRWNLVGKRRIKDKNKELLSRQKRKEKSCIFSCFSRTRLTSPLFHTLLAWREAAAAGRARSPGTWRHWAPFGSTATSWDTRCTSLAQRPIAECSRSLGQVKTHVLVFKQRVGSRVTITMGYFYSKS